MGLIAKSNTRTNKHEQATEIILFLLVIIFTRIRYNVYMYRIYTYFKKYLI